MFSVSYKIFNLASEGDARITIEILRRSPNPYMAT